MRAKGAEPQGGYAALPWADGTARGAPRQQDRRCSAKAALQGVAQLQEPLPG